MFLCMEECCNSKVVPLSALVKGQCISKCEVEIQTLVFSQIYTNIISDLIFVSLCMCIFNTLFQYMYSKLIDHELVQKLPMYTYM